MIGESALFAHWADEAYAQAQADIDKAIKEPDPTPLPPSPFLPPASSSSCPAKTPSTPTRIAQCLSKASSTSNRNPLSPSLARSQTVASATIRPRPTMFLVEHNEERIAFDNR